MKFMKKSNPRISLNKLGEYCEANSLRRKQIVYDAKHPKPFKTIRYSDAREAIKMFLIDDMDPKIIKSSISTISKRKADSDFQQNDNASSIAALKKILKSDLSIISGYTFQPHEDNHALINIAGVDISVNPDLLLVKNISSKDHIGGIKIHITKEGLKQESQKIIAAVLYRYIENYVVKPNQIAELKMCFSYDVFSEQLKSSPASYKLRMNRVEAACEEIALWWDNL